MHGNQCIIEFGLYLSAFSPLAKKCFKNRESLIGITQLQPEQYRKQAPDNSPDNTSDQELLTDCFMVHAEDILRNKRFLMAMMLIMMIRMCGNHSGMYIQYFTHILIFCPHYKRGFQISII